MIRNLEKYIKTQDEVNLVEEKLHDYDNLSDLIDILKDVFEYLQDKMEAKLEKKNTKYKTLKK